MEKRWKYFAAALIAFVIAEGLAILGMSLNGPDVTVLMYHSVNQGVLSEIEELSVYPEEMEKQLKYFCDEGVKTVFATELPGLRPRRGERYVCLTFDDGYEDNYTNLFPLLKKYNCKATIFMVVGYTGMDGYLKEEQMKEMLDSGLVSIQSHTVFHDALAREGATAEDIRYGLGESKRLLETTLGQKVSALSMPNGAYDDEIMDVAKEYYDVIFTASDFAPFSPDELTDIHRIGIYRRHTVDDVRRMTENRAAYLIKRSLQKLAGK